MYKLKKYENFDWTEDDFDFEEEHSNQEYIVFGNGNYILVGLKKLDEDGCKIMRCSTSGELLGFVWTHSFKNLYKLFDGEYNSIINNEEVLTAAGYTEHKYTLDEFKEFMNEDIPIKYYK